MDINLKKNNLGYRGSFFRNLIRRPEFGSIIGLIILWIFFSVAAHKGFNSIIILKSILDISVSIGIIAMFATLLLISGEFDLSVGSMFAATSMLLAICIVEFHMFLWLAIIVTFSFAILYGFIQGFIIVKAKMPSLIVTLGGLFFLRGLTYGVAQALIGRSIVGAVNDNLQDNWLFKIFASKFYGDFNVSIFWWIGLLIITYFILKRTKFGIWIYSTGGSETAARSLGVPTNIVKITLFMATAASVALLSIIFTLSLGSAESLRGSLKEMEVIITIVLGGTLISGGYGSPIGTFVGCLTIGLLRQGIYMLDIASEWYQSILGIILIIAILINRTGQRLEKL